MANRNVGIGAGGELASKTSGRFANAVSGAATVEWILPVALLDNIDIELASTGTLTGAFTIEISSSYRFSQGVNTAVTVVQAGAWTDITANGITKLPFCSKYGTDPAAGTSALRFILQWIPSLFVKVKYTATSGAGTITGYWNGKGF
jgi:hypothetical protein